MRGGRWPPRSFSPISFFSFLGAQNSFANPGVNDTFPQQGMFKFVLRTLSSLWPSRILLPRKSTQSCHPWPDFQKSTSPIDEFYGFAKPCSRAVVLDQAGTCLESEWGAEGGFQGRWIKMTNYHCSISWAMSDVLFTMCNMMQCEMCNVQNVQLSSPLHNVLFVHYDGPVVFWL